MTLQMTKFCKTCNTLKSLSEFTIDINNSDGLRTQCKTCKSIYDSNRKQIRAKQKRDREATDFVFALKNRLLHRLIQIIKQRGKYTKNNSLNDILGCSSIDFISYYESLFSVGMTWDNHGEWENDHMTPLITAKTVDDVIKLFHHTNLQPLWKNDNMAKKHYIDGIKPTHIVKPPRLYKEYAPVKRKDDIHRKALSNNDSKSTIAGVTFNKDRQKWRVRIRQKCYGLYDTLEEAVTVCVNVRAKVYAK